MSNIAGAEAATATGADVVSYNTNGKSVIIIYIEISSSSSSPSPSSSSLVTVFSFWEELITLSIDMVYIKFVRYNLKVSFRRHVCNF